MFPLLPMPVVYGLWDPPTSDQTKLFTILGTTEDSVDTCAHTGGREGEERES